MRDDGYRRLPRQGVRQVIPPLGSQRTAGIQTANKSAADRRYALRRAVTRESRQARRAASSTRRQTRHSRRGPLPGYNLKTRHRRFAGCFHGINNFQTHSLAGGFETNASTSLFSSALNISAPLAH